MATSTNMVVNPTLIRFARRVSHDLNNFSTVVRTYSELLLSELPADSTARADVGEIERAAEGMVAYLQRVTRFARAPMMRRVVVPVDEGIQDAVAEFRGVVPSREVHLPAVSGAAIEADPLWFRDVVGELLQNANDAAPAGTAITLRVATTDTHVMIDVMDQGAGMPPEWHDLLEPFATSKQGVRGAGQGLALVASFALALGGEVTFLREDAQTVARLTLPRAATT